uniref:Uncharacterized protein n=1 Tax=Arundo donax TaxID=35708 RepID=A0A0A8Y9Z7_ARUDO
MLTKLGSCTTKRPHHSS